MIFMFALAFAWVVFAVMQDVRSREIANWTNFSLIIFALAFRMFYSVFTNDYSFVLWGVGGLVFGFLIAHLFYYARIFAGGDAKLLIALCVVIPVARDVYTNALLMLVFFISFLLSGFFYSIAYSFVLSILNFSSFKKSFKREFLKRKAYFYVGSVFAILFLLMMFVDLIFAVPAFMVFVLPWLYVFTKAIEDSCMLRKIDVSKLTVGDWIEEEVKVGGRVVKPDWEGLSEEDLELLKKHHKKKPVLVKQGIPFSPAFLLGLVVFVVYVFMRGLG